MAAGRGGSSDLRNALLALVRTTLDQVGAVRDAAVRQAQSQRTFIDQALLSRRRKEALGALGEEIYARMLQGQLSSLAEEPSIAEHVADIAELDDAIAAAEEPADKPANWDRSRARHGAPGGGGARIWRPGESAGDNPTDSSPRPRRRRQRADAASKRGGIAFVSDERDDDDLSEFMHEDDVPNDSEA